MASAATESTAEAPATATAPALVRKQSSRRGSMDAGAAARRLSLQDMKGPRKNEVTTQQLEQREKNKEARRRSSLMRMGLGESLKSAAAVALAEGANKAQEGTAERTPGEQLEQMLTHAKEKGVCAEKLFEFFAPRGESSITPEAFESGLVQLCPALFKSLSKDSVSQMVKMFDSNNNGLIELSEFMEFCLSINSLAWKAEKARRLGNTDTQPDHDHPIASAARNVERRRSMLKAIPLGTVLHTSCKLFWRSKMNVDIAICENTDEKVITISTRCVDTGEVFPVLFLDALKIPISRKDVIASLEKGVDAKDLSAMEAEEKEKAITEHRAKLVVEYLLHRLKINDDGACDVDGGVERRRSSAGSAAMMAAAAAATAIAAANEGGGGGDAAAAAAAAATAAGGAAAGDTVGEPYIVKLSNDEYDTLQIFGAFTVDVPHSFRARRKSSMAAFRRKSAEVDAMADDIAALAVMAQEKLEKAEDTLSNTNS